MSDIEKEKIKKETCPDCKKEFHGYEKFQHHFETIHLGRRPFSCDYCQKAFMSIEVLANHINNVHNKFETFKCDICEQTLTNKGGLQTHVRRFHNFVHVKNNECDVCLKLFNDKYYLQ